jgi:hypothetical protein
MALRKLILLLIFTLFTAAFQTPAPEPEILSFTATPTLVSPIDGEFEIAWEAANAGAVMLDWYSHEGGIVEHLDLPLVGSMTLSARDISFNDGHVTIYLKLTERGSDLALPNAETGGYFGTSIEIALETPIEIVNFSANPVPAVPGGTLTIDWDVRNAESVRVSQYDHNLIPVSIFPDPNIVVPMQGSHTLELPDGYIGRKIGFHLRVTDANGVWITRILELEVQCAIPDHLAPLCPSNQFEQTLRWQPFDGGMIISYKRYEHSEGPSVQILLNDGHFYYTSPQGAPLEGTLVPPPDHFVPDALIDASWREYPAMREALGYATAPLQTYTTVYELVPDSDYNVIHTTSCSYLRWIDGRVMEICNDTGRWRFLGE